MANPDLIPAGETAGHKARKERVKMLAGFAFDGLKESPFMDAENTREIFAGTQFEGENHRRVAPYLQALFMERRRIAMGRLDNYAEVPPSTLKYDVIIIGSGPHGAAVAAYLREKRPKVTTLLLDQGRIGGQFRNYGDRPSFFMNSRVRKADRTLPTLPRTEGSINPLGMYAPLELSDVATSLYPSNTDMGDITALNGFVSATSSKSGITVTGVDYNYDGTGADKVVYAQTKEGQEVRFYTKLVVDATGLKGKSRLGFRNSFGGGALPPDRPDYFTPASFYRHFGTHTNPLKQFHDAKVMVVGGGDSALTVLEALVGQLPGSSYGMGSVGRYRPKSIVWWGAPQSNVLDLKDCLRNRYKNGIPQALVQSGSNGIIEPVRGTVTEVGISSGLYYEVTGEDNDVGNRYEYPNILIDCTRSALTRGNGWQVGFRIGPEAGVTFSRTILRAIERLMIPANQVALWATMAGTNTVSEEIVAKLG